VSRFALSNLAWPMDDEGALETLAEAGLNGVEVALTRIAPWEALDRQALVTYRNQLESHGLAAPSLQALLFGVEGVSLLGDEDAFERMVVHLSRVARCGEQLGAKIAVFGSPRQRSRGALSHEDAFELGASRFLRLAQTMNEAGMALGMEPVPKHYGGDFLTTADAVLAMVQAVNHPGLRQHLDTGCVLLGGGDIRQAIRDGADALGHFHIAEPDLVGFDAPQADHAGAAQALAEINYQGWLSIEMLQAKDGATAAALSALDFAQRTYAIV